MRYLVVIEKGETSWGAHVPDLPGCIAVAETREEVIELIKEAIDFHLEGLRERGEPVPAPSSESEFIETEMTQCFNSSYFPLYPGFVGCSSQARRFSYGKLIYVCMANTPSSDNIVSKKSALSILSPAARCVSLPA